MNIPEPSLYELYDFIQMNHNLFDQNENDISNHISMIQPLNIQVVIIG